MHAITATGEFSLGFTSYRRGETYQVDAETYLFLKTYHAELFVDAEPRATQRNANIVIKGAEKPDTD